MIPGRCPVVSLRKVKRLLPNAEYGQLRMRLLRRLNGSLSHRGINKDLQRSYVFVLCDTHEVTWGHSLVNLIDRIEVRVPGRRVSVMIDGEKRMVIPMTEKELLVYAKQ
ncbi:MAG: hypothetical protein IT410_00735 [Candidatus Doudnabacteria bacterium]|nr:hypothetical protein [Candidatus Doudnabacteria bacterium]